MDLLLYALDSAIIEKVILVYFPIVSAVLLISRLYLNITYKGLKLADNKVVLLSDFKLLDKEVNISEIVLVQFHDNNSTIIIQTLNEYFRVIGEQKNLINKYFQEKGVQLEQNVT